MKALNKIRSSIGGDLNCSRFLRIASLASAAKAYIDAALASAALAYVSLIEKVLYKGLIRGLHGAMRPPRSYKGL